MTVEAVSFTDLPGYQEYQAAAQAEMHLMRIGVTIARHEPKELLHNDDRLLNFIGRTEALARPLAAKFGREVLRVELPN